MAESLLVRKGGGGGIELEEENISTLEVVGTIKKGDILTLKSDETANIESFTNPYTNTTFDSAFRISTDVNNHFKTLRINVDHFIIVWLNWASNLYSIRAILGYHNPADGQVTLSPIQTVHTGIAATVDQARIFIEKLNDKKLFFAASGYDSNFSNRITTYTSIWNLDDDYTTITPYPLHSNKAKGIENTANFSAIQALSVLGRNSNNRWIVVIHGNGVSSLANSDYQTSMFAVNFNGDNSTGGWTTIGTSAAQQTSTVSTIDFLDTNTKPVYLSNNSYVVGSNNSSGQTRVIFGGANTRQPDVALDFLHFSTTSLHSSSTYPRTSFHSPKNAFVRLSSSTYGFFASQGSSLGITAGFAQLNKTINGSAYGFQAQDGNSSWWANGTQRLTGSNSQFYYITYIIENTSANYTARYRAWKFHPNNIHGSAMIVGSTILETAQSNDAFGYINTEIISISHGSAIVIYRPVTSNTVMKVFRKEFKAVKINNYDNSTGKTEYVPYAIALEDGTNTRIKVKVLDRQLLY
jgi:hypothetical protein